MAGIPAGLPAGVRLSDHISLGVIAKTFPPERVRQILAETGTASEHRSGSDWRRIGLDNGGGGGRNHGQIVALRCAADRRGRARECGTARGCRGNRRHGPVGLLHASEADRWCIAKVGVVGLSLTFRAPGVGTGCSVTLNTTH